MVSVKSALVTSSELWRHKYTTWKTDFSSNFSCPKKRYSISLSRKLGGSDISIFAQGTLIFLCSSSHIVTGIDFFEYILYTINGFFT